ncbi:hypothetical protein CC80DRAFT_231264 [Byssothecium circinans]|uniref:Extracellular serine-rich protein n=1 Tax=Byssothecium circinans TaxID=147558 RepID=A0A6A5U8W1_9PLEO|nr:hypothetical protein CC80DRAFT_231264 [Byssothecium circinans]
MSTSTPTYTTPGSSSPSTRASSTPSPTGTPSPSSSSSSSTAQQTHTVKVGSGGFKYEPQELKGVNVGDTVHFEFYPPDHSVARAEFGSPCVPYEYTGKNKTGFWSDTQWVKTVNDLTHFNLKINSSEPIFFYCAAPGSCIDHEMVGVINPNTTQTLDAQIRAAGKSSFSVKPGDPIPQEASSSLPNAPSATSTGTSSNSTPNTHHGLSGGVIAGIVVGAVAFLVLCAALFFYVGRTKSLKEMIKRKDATVPKTPDPYGGSQYGGSQYPGSPGFTEGSPYSPNLQQAEYGGQHQDQHPNGWSSPHMSMASPQMGEAKHGYQAVPVVELASPPPQQQSFAAELEAPATKASK